MKNEQEYKQKEGDICDSASLEWTAFIEETLLSS